MKHEVKIGGKVFPLAFTLKTLIDLQKEIKDFDLASLEISVAKDPKGLMDLLYLLASSGAALETKSWTSAANGWRRGSRRARNGWRTSRSP